MFLRRRFYLLLLTVALVIGLGYAYAPLFTIGRLLTLLLFIATLADIALLWHKRAVTAVRRLSFQRRRQSRHYRRRVYLSLPHQY